MVEPVKSWPEIRRDATRFAKEWRLAYDEKSQAQNFLVKFFEIFGIAVNQVATFGTASSCSTARKALSISSGKAAS